MPSTIVRELTSDAEILAGFSVMSQLRPHLKREEYVATIRRMMAGGYRQAASFDGPKIVAIAGFRVIEMLHTGLHIYIDDLITDESARSGGHGKAVMDWVVALARTEGCGAVELDSGTHRKAAHRFYLRERFEISSFHFRRELTPPGRIPS